MFAVAAGGCLEVARRGQAQHPATALPARTREVLEGSQQLVLYSLDPRPAPSIEPKADRRLDYHGYAVLGQTAVTDLRKRSDLLLALYDGIARSDGTASPCFNPRHGLRAMIGAETADLVICFECSQIEVHDRNGKQLVTTTRSPQPLLDRILSEARVPLGSHEIK